jgi:hypothetical protein
VINMKFTFFWFVIPGRPVDIYRPSRGSFRLILHGRCRHHVTQKRRKFSKVPQDITTLTTKLHVLVVTKYRNL